VCSLRFGCRHSRRVLRLSGLLGSRLRPFGCTRSVISTPTSSPASAVSAARAPFRIFRTACRFFLGLGIFSHSFSTTCPECL
jgi:hypothetical protein